MNLKPSVLLLLTMCLLLIPHTSSSFSITPRGATLSTRPPKASPKTKIVSPASKNSPTTLRSFQGGAKNSPTTLKSFPGGAKNSPTTIKSFHNQGQNVPGGQNVPPGGGGPTPGHAQKRQMCYKCERCNEPFRAKTETPEPCRDMEHFCYRMMTKDRRTKRGCTMYANVCDGQKSATCQTCQGNMCNSHPPFTTSKLLLSSVFLLCLGVNWLL